MTVSLVAMSMLYLVADSEGVLPAAMVAMVMYGIGSYAFNPAQQHR